MMKLIAIMALVCIAITQSTDNRKYIKVGQFFIDGDYERKVQGLPSTTIFLTEAMHNTGVANAKLWRDYQNREGILTYNNERVYVNLTLYNIGGYFAYYDSHVLANISKKVVDVMERENDTMFFFGLVGSAWTLEVIKAASTFKRIVLGTIASDRYLPQCLYSEKKTNTTTGATYNALPDECKNYGDRRFRNYFQTSMYNDFWPSDGLSKIHADIKLKKVAIFSVTGEAFATSQYSAAMSFFSSNNISVVADYKINPVSNVDPVGARRTMDPLIVKLQQYHPIKNESDWPDLIFGGGNEYVCSEFNNALNRAQFAPKALMMYCANTAIQNDFVVSYSAFECFLKGSQFFDAEFNITTQQYCDELKKNYSETNTVGAGTFKAGKVVANVISRAIDLYNYESLLYDVQATSIITSAGPVQFDSYGALNPIPTIVSQWYQSKRNILSPAANANHSLIYPMPKYFERVENFDYKTSEYVIFAFTAVALAFNIIIAIAILVLYTQRSHIISAATPEFLFIMLAGNTLCLISVYFWNISVRDISFCYLRVLFVSVGFICLFGALIIKTWRIAYLFSDVSMNIKSVSTKQLLLILVLFIAVDAIFLVGLLAGASFYVKKIQVDEFRPYYNYLSCEYPEGKEVVGTVFTWILVGYKIALVLAGVVCSLMIRKVKYLHLNESKWIGFAIYNLTIVFIPVLIISIVDVSNETRFIIRSVFIIFISISTNALIFLPKFYYRIRGKDQSKRLMHSGGTSNNQINKKSNKSSSSIKNISELEDIEEIEKYLQSNTNMKKLEKGLNKTRELIKMYSEFTKSFEKIENRFIEKIIHLQNRKN